MLKKLKLPMIALMAFSLVGCQKGESTNSSSATTSGFDVVIPDPRTSMEIWEDALETSYTNLTIDVAEYYSEGEDFFYYQEKIVEGYLITYDEYMGYDFFTSYEGELYTYFPNTYSNGDAWIKDNYYGYPYASNYFNMQLLIEELAKTTTVQYESNGNYYYIADDLSLARFNRTVFQSFLEVNVDAGVFIYVDSVTSTITKVAGLTWASDEELILVQMGDFGETTYYGVLPPHVASADTVMTFAEWKGIDPWNPIMLQEVQIAYPAYFDGTMDIGQTYPGQTWDGLVRLLDTYLPEGSKETTVLDIDWMTDDTTGVIELNQVVGSIRALKPGTVNVWVKAWAGGNTYIESNKLSITVKELPEADIENLAHDLVFTNFSGGVVSFVDKVADAETISVTGTKGGLATLSNPNTNIFPKHNQVLCLNYNIASAATVFNFGSEEVTGIAMNLGLAYLTNDRSNSSYLTKVELQTSADGESWTTAADLTDQAKTLATASYISIQETFAATSHVRIVIESSGTTMSKYFRLATDNILFYSETSTM